MAFEESLRSVSLLADASIAGYTGVPGLPGSADPNAGKIFRFVKVTGNKYIVGLAVGVTDNIIGVLQNKPQVVGQAATVGIRGISMVVAGANDLNAGDEVGADTEGRAIKVTGTNPRAGTVLSDSTAVGELVAVLLG